MWNYKYFLDLQKRQGCVIFFWFCIKLPKKSEVNRDIWRSCFDASWICNTYYKTVINPSNLSVKIIIVGEVDIREVLIVLRKNHNSKYEVKTMKGLDTVESLSAEASDNLSTNSFCMMKTIFTALGFTKTRALVWSAQILVKYF